MGSPKIYAIFEEIHRIGLVAFIYRLWMLFSNKTGLDVKIRPTVLVNEEYLKEACEEGVPTAPEEFYRWWCEQPNRFFVDTTANANLVLQAILDSKEQTKVIERGRDASKGKIYAFRAWTADFENPPKWTLNPLTGQLWPGTIHSKRILIGTNKKRYGDIKLTWELGRFLHIPDIIRAYFISGDEALIDGLFEQITSFDAENPLYLGPHWVSEQEVGIRACMFAFVLYSLRESGCLNGTRVRLIHRQLVACAEFCDKEIEFARKCITNNHLIAGALGIYLPGYLMPWCKRAQRWQIKGRKILLNCLRTQWYSDGGYIQPSHNYHRLALSYLLWVYRLAEKQGDSEIITEINKCFGKSFELLNGMIDQESGMLPNWGPNDGSYFFSCTNCDFSDFRPILTSMRFALSGKRQYQDGPWDEQLFWLWGEKSLQASTDYLPSTENNYPFAGLHSLHQKDGLAVLRAGPVLSRYGQHADQLHVDIFWKGENAVLDTGSYLYGNKLHHEWFRSTDAHSTVIVAGESQMVPHRQFLFLRWPHAKLIPLPPPPKEIRAWYLGWHDGYMRLDAKIQHWRILAELNDGRWLVLDYLRSFNPGKPLTVAQRWHFCSCETNLFNNKIELKLKAGNFGAIWAGTSSPKVALSVGDASGPDGWHSRYYGKKNPSPSLHLVYYLLEEHTLTTLFGPTNHLRTLKVEPVRREICIDDKKISLENLRFWDK